jgi:hypothetical protein
VLFRSEDGISPSRRKIESYCFTVSSLAEP